MNELAFILIGLFLGVPFSIGANLATPRWQAFWSKRSERARLRNEQRMEDYVSMVVWFAKHPAELQVALAVAQAESRKRYLQGVPTFMAFAILLQHLVRNPQTAVPQWWTSAAVCVALTCAGMFWVSTGASIGTRARNLAVNAAEHSGWPVDILAVTPKPGYIAQPSKRPLRREPPPDDRQPADTPPKA
ncbi:hypothetical protein Ait01nite_053180 [Actinoplanes italicus]|uniref:Uncharacterized protein n=1 Tax=Actinoplanes italicus TaxID=113567 RepID=A0A2T0JZR4_9ACTN|nr:hypothetical protein [Actinoplanes italicus]PRX15968.1 hypothetical protein CLV67_12115 [Actinoplanes italicus]GIE32273.1 hypothetical protein Ait01nite_053180 [Actinoplanes italicus]